MWAWYYMQISFNLYQISQIFDIYYAIYCWCFEGYKYGLQSVRKFIPQKDNYKIEHPKILRRQKMHY